MNIIEMARQAGINAEADTLCRNEGWVEPLEAFAKLVAAHTLMNIDPSKFMSHHEGIEAGRLAEREACAKVCEAQGEYGWQQYADAIRARGEKA